MLPGKPPRGTQDRPRERTDGPRAPERTPSLPASPAHEDSDLGEDLRRFHVTGPDPGAPAARGALRPAGLATVLADGALEPDPIFLPADATQSPVPLSSVLRAALETEGATAPIAAREATRLAALVERTLEERASPTPLPEALEAALERLPQPAEPGRDELAAFREALRSRAPAGAVAGPGTHTPLVVHARIVARDRRARRAAFRARARSLVDGLAALLGLDAARSPEAGSADALSPRFGRTGEEFLDPAALARHVPRRHGVKRLDPRRRTRIESAHDELRDWLAREAAEPTVWIVEAEGSGVAGRFEGCSALRDPEPIRAATRILGEAAERWVPVVRAARTAALELQGAYDVAKHDWRLSALDWQGFTEDELRLVPAIVVSATAERLRGTALAELSDSMRSGRPVHVLVVTACSGPPELGYLALTHRETFVLQSTLARPDHLLAGLDRVAASPGPAVAIVGAVAPQGPASARARLAAAWYGRALPCFTYDPAAGETWAACFELSPNPQPERPWPVCEIPCRDATGRERRVEEPFTFAHAAALDPDTWPHLRVISPEAWSGLQLEIGEYLALPRAERRKRLPFVWLVDEDARLARAVVTRELAHACHDRGRAWRMLQELAGIDNEHARRAAATARQEAQAESAAERAALVAAHETALAHARNTAATEALERLALALVDPDRAAAALAAPAGAAVPADAPTGAPTGAGAAQPAAEPPAAPTPAGPPTELARAPDDGKPYIDTPLCTTCNECTEINRRMFRYNDDKQAYLADAAAGTFRELVRAAEKCQARCIHPGRPRPGDKTASAELIARAEALERKQG